MESRRISLLKALSWRLIAVIVTTTVAYLWSQDVKVAASIGAVDSAIKILAYYLHERAWVRAMADAANRAEAKAAPAHGQPKTC